MSRGATAIVTFIVSIAAVTLLAGQGRDSWSGLIVGQVVDGSSGRPLADAVVSLTGPPSMRGVPQRRILTRADGRFFFPGLRAGSYGVMATRGGYTDGAYGRMRPLGPSLQIELTDGGRFGEAIVRLWKHAAISGTVLDEAGEPQVRVAVMAYRRGFAGGRVRYVPARTGATDDRGMFRIGGLTPGQWIVGTSIEYRSATLTEAREAAELARSGNIGAQTATTMILQNGFVPSGDAGFVLTPGTLLPPPDTNGSMVYMPTYHPAATAAEGASAISLTSGQEYVGADLRITPVRGVPVTGVITGPEGPLPMTQVRLISGDAMDLVRRAWLTAGTDRGGRFSFPAVPSGQYRLRLRTARGRSGSWVQGPVESYIAWADIPLSVGIEPIENLQVETSEGLSVGGWLEFSGDASRQRAANNVEIRLEPVDPDPGEPTASTSYRTNGVGEFRSPGALVAGHYYVRVANSPRGWMFLGATLEGRDVTDSPLHLTSNIQNIVVSFTDRWSGVQGAVQNDAGRDAGALVIAFSTDRELWASSAGNARRIRSTRTGRTGEYAFTLPPGDYYVVAVPDETAADWQDPGFLEAAGRAGTQVRIAPGERKTQDLRTRSVR